VKGWVAKMLVTMMAEGNGRFEDWIPSLVVLVATASVAFAVGMFLRYRRAKIQREYQERMEASKRKQQGGP
jgi:hypothetical protein